MTNEEFLEEYIYFTTRYKDAIKIEKVYTSASVSIRYSIDDPQEYMRLANFLQELKIISQDKYEMITSQFEEEKAKVRFTIEFEVFKSHLEDAIKNDNVWALYSDAICAYNDPISWKVELQEYQAPCPENKTSVDEWMSQFENFKKKNYDTFFMMHGVHGSLTIDGYLGTEDIKELSCLMQKYELFNQQQKEEIVERLKK